MWTCASIPRRKTEQTQLKIYSGARTLDMHAGAVFIRMEPERQHARGGQLTPCPVDPRLFSRADEVFRGDVPKSFGLDLGDVERGLVVARAAAWRLSRGY